MQQRSGQSAALFLSVSAANCHPAGAQPTPLGILSAPVSSPCCSSSLQCQSLHVECGEQASLSPPSRQHRPQSQSPAAQLGINASKFLFWLVQVSPGFLELRVSHSREGGTCHACQLHKPTWRCNLGGRPSRSPAPTFSCLVVGSSTRFPSESRAQVTPQKRARMGTPASTNAMQAALRQQAKS